MMGMRWCTETVWKLLHLLSPSPLDLTVADSNAVVLSGSAVRLLAPSCSSRGGMGSRGASPKTREGTGLVTQFVLVSGKR